MSNKEILTLKRVLDELKESVESRFSSNYWICAEIGEISSNYSSGHCYLELIEKDSEKGVIIARVRAIIWSSYFRVIKPYFESSTGASLESGMKILVRCKIDFSQQYGLSLNINDIEPSYTIGEAERIRLETLQRLRDEGLIDMNRELSLPLIPKRFAIISSATAAGYRDFMKHTTQNEYGYKFETTLFPALMQGVDSPNSIIEALDAIAQRCDEFDAVMIMRGGGSAVELSCFDDFNLCANIAQFPLPVMSGVGHDHDIHICDLVSAISVKTPTALADYIINIYLEAESYLDELMGRISRSCKSLITNQIQIIERLQERIYSAAKLSLVSQMNLIEKYEVLIKAKDPRTILKDGYIIASGDNGRIGSVENINKGEVIKLIFSDGIAEVTIDNIKKY